VTFGAREILVLAAIAAVLATLHPRIQRRVVVTRAPAANLQLTDGQRSGSMTFAPGTHPLDVAAVQRAIAGARPEARRLIDLVDGALTVRVGPTGEPDAAGVTESGPGGFSVTLDLGQISRALGERGISRLVLHELGHVVDYALVPPALREQLDAAVPPSYPCTAAGDSSCAGRSDREERFAETFAKWAMDDIGTNLEIGYRVPPPPSLMQWGRPLTALR
jgi:hypothetical protein